MLATEISNYWTKWHLARQETIRDWDEIRRYIFATDTTKTSNSKLPWKNKTTVPKLTQIRDNLHANYMASLFPKRKWLHWMAENKSSADVYKRTAIEDYMRWVTDHPEFKQVASRLILDYIDYGNCFSTVEWVDDNHFQESGKATNGYQGPVLVRISPLDIVFNPISNSFQDSPKIIRSIVQRGDLYGMLENNTEFDEETKENLKKYFIDIRSRAHELSSDLSEKDSYLRVDGFDSFRYYLESDYVELLTFYGDIYDPDTGTFKRNRKIIIADRHKIISDAENPSFFSNAPIFHSGWRLRQDNLWAMGPLENLVGMQYRIDHIENLKADVFDLNAFPPLKIKGYVEDFEWGPMERIYVGDDGDVQPLSPDVSILQANMEIQTLQAQMEEMAGAPKEAAGFRTPGEKTAFEVQRIENAYNRIFSAKIRQFEEFLEYNLNAMLELGKRKMTERTIALWNDELKIQVFKNLTREDITGTGRIRPMAAQHFAEKSEKIQNLTSLFQTLGADPSVRMHFSSVKIAQVIEELLDLEKDEIVQPYVQISEQQDAARMQRSAQETLMVETTERSGIRPDDYDEDIEPPPEEPPAEGQ
jgi:hypothetical protein